MEVLVWKSLILIAFAGCAEKVETLPEHVFGDTRALCDPGRTSLPAAHAVSPTVPSPLCRLAAIAERAAPPSTSRIGLAYRCVGGTGDTTELEGALSGMVSIGKVVLLGRDGVVSRLTGDERLLQAKQSVASCVEHGCTELSLPGKFEKSPVPGVLTFARGIVEETGFWLAYDPGPDGSGCTRMMVFPDVPVDRDGEPGVVTSAKHPPERRR